METKPFKIYNASAGAGKTYTLVFEFLTILLQKSEPESFRELLAITFTNKAANEMKERIIEQLQKLANGEVSEDEFRRFEENTGLGRERIQVKAQAILTAILHNYALFSVSTIDKFNLRLMRAFSQDMGLSLNFDVEMDVKDILKESVDVLFSELEEKSDLSDLITRIAIENLDEDKHWDVSREITEKASTLFQDKFLEELKLLEKVPLEKLIAFRKKARENYIKSRKRMQSLAQDVLDFVEKHNLNVNDFKYKKTGVLSYYEKIMQGDAKPYGPRQQKLVEDGTILSNNTALNDEMLVLVTEKYEGILKEVLLYNFWQTVYKNINPVTTLNEVDKKLEEIKQENNILLISEFNKIISENIKDQPTPFIYEKIGNRYKNFFIDEFQDTSNLQWENLKPLLENAIATNDTVMIVGDPKQSIYRFRGGNPELMIDLYQNEDTRIHKENLPKNWRSYEEIITFNNLLFTHIADTLQNPQYKELYLLGNKQEVNDKKGGYVQIDYLEMPERGSGKKFFEDVVTPNLIENIKNCMANGFSYHEMCILVRQKSEGKRIAEALAEEGIEVISNESLLLNNATEVQLLLAFIKFMSDKENKSNRADLLLMLDLCQLLEVEDHAAFYHNILNERSAAFILALKEKGIDLTFTNLPFKTLYDQVASAIRAFGLDKKGGSYITFFMDELLSFQQKKEVTASAFIEYWDLKGADKSIAMPKGNEAIQLMTIHKSKGLEFPVVFLPAANWTSKPGGVWVSLENEPIERLYMDEVKSVDHLPEDILANIIEEEMQAELDSLNMLYVATTRAVEQLYIGTQLIKNDSKNQTLNYFDSLAKIYPKDEFNSIRFGEIQRVSKPKLTESNIETVPYISTEWTEKIRVSKEHALLWDESRADSINYGNKMHAILEKLNHVEDASELLTQFELQGFISTDEKESIATELDQLFSITALVELFNAETFLNERDFISTNGLIFRPDRLVRMDDGWVLIDYKTGEPLQKHKNQINQYAEDLTELGFDISKKYLLYLGSGNKVVEIG
ncbi:AAA family ATPase [Flavobacteriaceae bacterium Ap0902]|nr:AAA family ATPase [Flavobacteriaceae bacterium Ap0902]